EKTPLYVKMAMDDLETLEHDFMAALGDLVQNRAKLYDDYKSMILERSSTPVFSLAGNGDLGAGLDAYQVAISCPLYYYIYRQGIRFIFTSVTKVSGGKRHICHLGPEQLAWLRKELELDRTSTTVIFSHPPIFETTERSGKREQTEKKADMYLYESAELRDLFKSHPNVKVFAHGHLHHRYGLTDGFGRGGYCKEGDVLHISVGATANNRGSSMLYITRDLIKVKARDHENHAWLDEYEYNYPVKTTFTAEDKYR
ncbi:MAG: metallophosphoesterase family protein, partial [Planctomycetota bacterium]